jgi:hypothetical protein
MSHRFQVVLSDEQYAFLDREADRSSVSMAELVRRAIDTTYGLADDDRVVFSISHTLGRRSGRGFDSRRYASPFQ